MKEILTAEGIDESYRVVEHVEAAVARRPDLLRAVIGTLRRTVSNGRREEVMRRVERAAIEDW